MSSDRPTEFEQLPPEAAARVDAACDRFERAWKAVRPGGPPPPSPAGFLDSFSGPERTILIRELDVVDRACRARYGGPARSTPEVLAAVVASTSPDPEADRLAHLPPGRWPIIPGLQLLEVVGAGGMGVVIKARQPALGREVAVKLLREPHAADSEPRERFRQEARAVARLQHPNLVQLHEFGEVSGSDGAAQPYLVMEYVPGGSLADLLRRSPLSPAAAARLVEELARGVHHAHQQGVIHRDLKPANVLLAAGPLGDSGNPVADLSPKVADFGLARFRADPRVTRTGDVLGTPCYMAPEQAAGDPEAVTAAVDVYGLGAILYELLAGRPPFGAATVEATIRGVREDVPLPPRRVRPAVPRDLENVCLMCLRKEPGRRYSTAGELAEDLRRFRAREPVRARPVRPGERVVRWCRRKPLAAGLLAALAVVLVSTLSVVLWQWDLNNRKAAEVAEVAAGREREREVARREKDQNLRLLSEWIDQLAQTGRDLARRPELYGPATALMEKVLAYYEQVLRESGGDPQLRHEAARMFGELANIYHSTGQWAKAVNDYRRQRDLLEGLYQESGDPDLARRLAVSCAARGNVLRDLGRVEEARAAYDEAAALQRADLDRRPGDPAALAALANTLRNKATLLSAPDDVPELKVLYMDLVNLEREAVAAGRGDLVYQKELALGLEDQGLLLLTAGQLGPAETAIREALGIRLALLESGQWNGSIERYVARNYTSLARVLAATGRAPEVEEAEAACRKAIGFLEPMVQGTPLYPYHRIELAQALACRSVAIDGPGRKAEVVAVRQQVVKQYEHLRANFREDRTAGRVLAASHLSLVRPLRELGKRCEAADHVEKARGVAAADPAAAGALAWFLATDPDPGVRNAAEAVRLAEQAVRSDGGSGEYWNTLGVAQYRAGDDRAAITALEKAMSLRRGGHSFDWFFLAMARARLGDRTQARVWFDRAVGWMDEHMPANDELSRFRKEAADLLGP
jgi:serine/threonine protein kinase